MIKSVKTLHESGGGGVVMLVFVKFKDQSEPIKKSILSSENGTLKTYRNIFSYFKMPHIDYCVHSLVEEVEYCAQPKV